MSNDADRDSDQFGIKMSAGLAPKEGKGWHDGKSQQCNHLCSCIVSPHPRHSDKLKHGVPGGQAGWKLTIWACFFQITEGKAQPPFQKNVGFVRFKC